MQANSLHPTQIEPQLGDRGKLMVQSIEELEGPEKKNLSALHRPR